MREECVIATQGKTKRGTLNGGEGSNGIRIGKEFFSEFVLVAWL